MTYQSKRRAIVPIISVILPVFNAEKYVKEAVHSILEQTFHDFELIIINDGSTDNTIQILKQFKGLDERVILVSRENKGLVETLNEGIDIARGQWIARMDADDISLPNRFERQLQWLEQTSSDVCGSWVKLFGTTDKRILKHPQTDAAVKMEMLFGTPFAHPSVMIKSESLKLLRYDKVWENCEDYDLWERAAHAGWKMTNVPEVLLLYRQHDTQISASAASQQQLLTQNIRRRYWEFIFDSMKLEKAWIDEVLKLRAPLPSKPNLTDVNSAFSALLQQSCGEARTTIFDHVTRLYFRAACISPDAVKRWSDLNRKFGEGFSIGIKVKLVLLSLFPIRPSSYFFRQIKKIYFRL